MLLMPFQSPSTMFLPTSKIAGMPLISPFTIDEIIWGIFDTKFGMARISPLASAAISLIPPSISFGKLSISLSTMTSTISRTQSISISMLSRMPLTSAMIKSMPAATMLGRFSSKICTANGMIVWDASVMSCVSPWMMIFIRGIIFSPTVTRLSTNCSVSVLKLALSSAMPTSRLPHAAFMDETEPWMVVLASSVVVSYMPIST